MIQPSTNNVPRHVGIILDGNRRFAKRLMLKPWKGHEWGAKKVEGMLEWCEELGIDELTLYAFSIENFNRPKDEFDELMTVFKDGFDKLAKDPRLDTEKRLRIRFLGRIGMFPAAVQEKMRWLEEKTKDNGPKTINFAMAYGGRAEIIDATKKIAAMVKDGALNIDAINEEVFAKQLYTDSEPDLIIRTSGEQRTSGFMLWQGSYAELYFCPKLWPEFEKEDFLEALTIYANRERRFGK